MVSGTGKGLLTTGLPGDQGESDSSRTPTWRNVATPHHLSNDSGTHGRPREPKKGTGPRPEGPAAALPFPGRLLPPDPLSRAARPSAVGRWSPTSLLRTSRLRPDGTPRVVKAPPTRTIGELLALLFGC